MAIRQRGGSWVVDLKTPSGIRKRVSFPTLSEAQAKHDEWSAEPTKLEGAASPLVIERTVGGLLGHMWKAHYQPTQSSATRSTGYAIQGLIEALGKDTPIATLTRIHLDAYTGRELSKGRSPATINRRLAILSTAITYARDLGWEVKLGKIRRVRGQESRLGFLTREEVAQIVALLHTWGYSEMARYVLVLAYTGMRPSEGLNMTVRDIAEDGGSVRIPTSKTGKPRTIPLGITPRGALAEQVASLTSGTAQMSQKVFSFNYTNFQKVWERVRGHLGKTDDAQWVPYILRHSFASWLVQKGIQLQAVAELMGHADLTMTLRYAKLTPSHLSDAVQGL